VGARNSRDALLRRCAAGGLRHQRTADSHAFFAGWGYEESLCAAENRIAHAYAGGVPMGGMLTGSGQGKPRFLVLASQDPGTTAEPGTQLQRLQIIKGWLTPDGNYREQVVDVAGDAGNGASVNPQTCAEHGNGFKELCAVWTDDEFRPQEQAYYYARVVENPSCRWSQQICMYKGVDCSKPETIGEGLQECCAPEHQPIIQERAWTSPVWYTPVSQAPAEAQPAVT